jgi:hypothetical protein
MTLDDKACLPGNFGQGLIGLHKLCSAKLQSFFLTPFAWRQPGAGFESPSEMAFGQPTSSGHSLGVDDAVKF